MLGVLLKAVLITAYVMSVLFSLSMLIYYFNLDMKLMTKIVPFLNMHYDKIKHDQCL